MQDQPVSPEETLKEQNRQEQNSHQRNTTEFFQETSTEGGMDWERLRQHGGRCRERAQATGESFPLRKDTGRERGLWPLRRGLSPFPVGPRGEQSLQSTVRVAVLGAQLQQLSRLMQAVALPAGPGHPAEKWKWARSPVEPEDVWPVCGVSPRTQPYTHASRTPTTPSAHCASSLPSTFLTVLSSLSPQPREQAWGHCCAGCRALSAGWRGPHTSSPNPVGSSGL